MTVSASTRSTKQLWSDLLVALGGEEGFLTRDLSERQFLIEILNTFGGSYSKRTIGGRENILAAIVIAAGGNASPRHSQPELMAALVVALGGDPIAPYSSSMSELLAAAVNAADTGGSGGEYVAGAVTFDGNTGLYLANVPNVVSSSKGTLFHWYKIDISNGAAQGPTFFGNLAALRGSGLPDASAQNQVQSYLNWTGSTTPPGPGSYEFQINDVANTNDSGVYALGSTADATWRLTAVTWDTDHAAGSRVYQILHDGVLKSVVLDWDDGVAFNVNWANPTPIITVGCLGWDADDAIFEPVLGDASDFYLNIAERVDLSDAAVVSKIISGGKPVDQGASGSLLTGSQPLIYLSGNAVTYANNKGSAGGTFTIVGTLTNATTSPSD